MGNTGTRLKRLAFRSMAVLPLAAVVAFPGGARADALHAFCFGTSTCSDNGTITPTLTNPPEFGFTKSPDSDSTTKLLLEVLIPDNVSGASSESFSISGTHTGNGSVAASLFSFTPWTSGQLDSYLGISASPTNPIGAFLPTTQAFQPTATGYYAYQLNFGGATFGASTDPEFTTSFGFPKGSIVTAFAFGETDCVTKKRVTTCTDKYTATANSGALAIERDPRPTPTPEPATAALMGIGLLGLGTARVRRRRG
ncbi:MAG TPA: PEP-CTERM sorting domain-containing protein [Acetobacteraceae bacterium]|nr:PEP-CTERM sorting domain-containing protein [Acetobacteraceae bacterium]